MTGSCVSLFFVVKNSCVVPFEPSIYGFGEECYCRELQV